MNLLMMFETVISSPDSAVLNNSLRSGSEKVVNSVVQRVGEALSDSVENDFNWSARREFLESVEVKLDLLLCRNSSTEEVDTGIKETENHSKLQDSRLSKNRSRLSSSRHQSSVLRYDSFIFHCLWFL
ncbi:hypothetical protein AOLI_G00291310 [Acnodon oligacanthus]